MKNILVFAQTLFFASVLTPSQGQQAEIESPKQVVEKYWKMETAGGRLTAQGWHKGDAFYVRPIPPPRDVSLLVVHADFSVWDPVIKDDVSEVIVGIRLAGRIDPTLRYEAPDSQSAKSGVLHHLVCGEKHWQLEAGDTVPSEVIGPREWRIEDTPLAGVYVTVDTAIRYVRHQRDITKDPAIKRNADITLAALRRISKP